MLVDESDYRGQSRVGEVGLGRGSDLSAGPFPQVVFRTRRTPFDAPGSPQILRDSCAGPYPAAGQGSGIIDLERYSGNLITPK